MFLTPIQQATLALLASKAATGVQDAAKTLKSIEGQNRDLQKQNQELLDMLAKQNQELAKRNEEQLIQTQEQERTKRLEELEKLRISRMTESQKREWQYEP